MKTLIIYYSWSGNTKRVAENIHHEVKNSDLVEIKVPAGTFSADMYKTNDIFKEQIEVNHLPKIDLQRSASQKAWDFNPEMNETV